MQLSSNSNNKTIVRLYDSTVVFSDYLTNNFVLKVKLEYLEWFNSAMMV